MATFECARCHRLFQRTGMEEVCSSCLPTEENEFSKIKEYLSIHPGASSSEVMSELKISLQAIKRYLREDRLEIVGESKGFIRCELCGRPINSGRFCNFCYKEGQALMQKENGGVRSAYIKPVDGASSKYKSIDYKDNAGKKTK